MQEPLTKRPAITSALLAKGKNTIGHETNLARAPLWQSRPQSDNDVATPTLYGHPFRQVEGASLTIADQRLLAYVTTTFVRADCPWDRRVPFSLGEAALALGHEGLGGRQRNLVRASLARTRSVTIESKVRHPDGQETVIGWGFIDSYFVTTRGGGMGWVALSDPLAQLLREGSVTYLHEPTWKAICAEDEVAGRLWCFLESERVRPGWRYPVFPSPASEDSPSSRVPPIAEVLMLRWASRRKVAQRVREACVVIMAHDRHYRLEVVPAKSAGGWNLVCSGSPHAPSAPVGSGLPAAVLRAWRKVYRSQLPSVRQRGVLVELLERHPAEWIEATLTEASECDPFRHLMDEDRRFSDARLAAARQEEREWEQQKQREIAEAKQSMMTEALRTYAPALAASWGRNEEAEQARQ